MENGHGHQESRLDRIERIIEVVASRQADVEEEFARLLKAQIVLQDNLGKFQGQVSLSMSASNSRMDRVEQNLAEATDKINALLTMMDQHMREHREGIR